MEFFNKSLPEDLSKLSDSERAEIDSFLSKKSIKELTVMFQTLNTMITLHQEDVEKHTRLSQMLDYVSSAVLTKLTPK